jgi:hypothetical protein
MPCRPAPQGRRARRSEGAILFLVLPVVARVPEDAGGVHKLGSTFQGKTCP